MMKNQISYSMNKDLQSMPNEKLTILIPMAGAGSRFADEGYQDPKPLIDVSGKPMVVQAIKSLPQGENYIFICRTEHIKNYGLSSILKSEFSSCKIIDIDYLTEGQASTCYLANKHIANDKPLLIGACDYGMTWNHNKYNTCINDDSIDALIWTFRNNVTVRQNPQMYGWVSVGSDNVVKNVSCKIPLSNNPINDHAIVGTFWFRKAEQFFYYAKKLIEKNRRINNEFYVDEVMNELIENGLRVKVFEISKYVCWGTPNDLKVFQYWEEFFSEISN